MEDISLTIKKDDSVEKKSSETKKSESDTKKGEDDKKIEKKEVAAAPKAEKAEKAETENGEFSAIEILVPTTELAKDKELINKIKPPKWESYTYVNDNGKCVSKHHENEEEAKNYYKTELMNNPKANRLILAQGNVI